jgi:DNA-binding transcriptional regulator YiaG
MPRVRPETIINRTNAREAASRDVATLMDDAAMRTFAKQLSNAIKAKRLSNGMRSKDMAAVIGVSEATYSRWEIRPGDMTVKQLALVCAALGWRTFLRFL